MTRALGLLLGCAADRAFGDPRRLHPVAGFGALASRLERHTYGNCRTRGMVHEALLVGGAIGLGLALDRWAADPITRTTVVAAATWVVLGARSLEREADAVHAHLSAGDLSGARRRVGGLVGRDTADLDADEIARAVVESVAENTSDAVVAPLLWGALLGPAGLLGYRAINTLDAMIGYRGARYTRFGWAAARVDDLANLPASRLSALLVLAARPGRAVVARRAWARDAAAHPSPNAGVVEAAFAGSLGVLLGGTNRYHGERIEHRAVLGEGRAPTASDIPRALCLARRVGLGAALVGALVAIIVTRETS